MFCIQFRITKIECSLPPEDVCLYSCVNDKSIYFFLIPIQVELSTEIFYCLVFFRAINILGDYWMSFIKYEENLS